MKEIELVGENFLESIKGKGFVAQMQAIQTVAQKSRVGAKALFDPALRERIAQEIERAAPVTAAIVARAQQEAAQNLDMLVVMKLEAGNEQGFSDYDPAETDNTLSVAKMGVMVRTVFEYCQKELKVTPVVRRMVTENSDFWYEMVISWERVQERY